jgi:hypothetical protein
MKLVRIESGSEAGKFYNVLFFKSGKIKCVKEQGGTTCIGFSMRGTCSHVKKGLEIIAAHGKYLELPEPVDDAPVNGLTQLGEQVVIRATYLHGPLDAEKRCTRCGMSQEFWGVAGILCRGYKTEVEEET